MAAVKPGTKYAYVLAQIDLVLRVISDGVTIQDSDGHLLYANDTAAVACGFPDAQSLVNGDLRELFEQIEMLDVEGKPIPPARLPGRRALAGEVVEPFLVRCRDRRNGRQWWCLLRADAVLDENGVPELVVNLWHDVTAEQRQLQRERFLAVATERLAASIDYETTLASVAQALVPELADWVTVELVADDKRSRVAIAHVDPSKVQLARELAARFPEDPEHPGAVTKVLGTGKSQLISDITPEMIAASARSDEHRVALQSVGLRSVMIVPIVAGDRTEGAISLVTAESGHRYDALDLSLAEEIGRRAGTAIVNARIHRAAEDAIRARDDFLAVAGHELRTPLAALVLQLESIAIAMGSGTLLAHPERYQTRVTKALDQTHRLARLVDALLDVTRVATGRLEVRRESCNLADVVREVVERLETEIVRSGSTVTIDAPERCMGDWDCQRIDQVVGNLLGNALKYGAGRPVLVACRVDGDRAFLRVVDHGIGIADADRQRIFGRFERAVSERNFGGLGLGLWIVRRVIEAHGGSISLTDTEGGGSTFEIELPAAS